MASPLSVSRNNYRNNPKRSDIYTPLPVADFIYDILSPLVPQPSIILDPAIGKGALVKPWVDSGNYYVQGVDIEKHENGAVGFWMKKFEDVSIAELPKPDLILCNPPFNGAAGKKLYPEVFVRKINDLFGAIPTVMFTPMGFRLNQRKKSERWKWVRDSGWQITSIISLPLDIFPNVEFHCEVLVFNLGGVEPHYFLPESAL